MDSRYSLILIVGLLIAGCRPATPPPGPADLTPTGAIPASETTTPAAAPTTVPDEVKEVRNAQYQLGATNALQVVQLKDGKYQQDAPGATDFIAVDMTDFAAAGDLNADGKKEAAALVSENYGGSGVFVFLAIFANTGGKWTFETSTMVDDRPQLNALSIEKGEVYLDATIHGTDDPMCCPTLRTTRHFRLVDNQLDMTDYATFTPDGKPHTVNIESPATGTEVFSSVPLKGNVAIAPFENNLVYQIYDVSGIELSAGAIPVQASQAGAPGTFDETVSLGKVLSGAIIRIEVQDLSAKDGSLLGMDSVELVVK